MDHVQRHVHHQLSPDRKEEEEADYTVDGGETENIGNKCEKPFFLEKSFLSYVNISKLFTKAMCTSTAAKQRMQCIWARNKQQKHTSCLEPEQT